MRIATWNVNGIGARLPRLSAWLEAAAPEVVCLQELKCAEAAFPHAALRELGYDAAVHTSGRWNGVAVLSRIGLEDVRFGFPDDPGFGPQGAPEPRSVAATCGGVRVRSVYVPNGRALDDPHYAYKLQWLRALTTDVAADLARHERLVVGGDYNVARTDQDVWDPALFVDATHVTPAERAAVDRLEALGLTDLLPRPSKGDRRYTYWDYRAGSFHRNWGMRIDLLLASAPLAAAARDVWVDTDARRGPKPSDHAPLVGEFDVPGGDAA